VVVHYFTKNKTMRKGECYGAGIGNGIGAKAIMTVLYVAAPMLGLACL